MTDLINVPDPAAPRAAEVPPVLPRTGPVMISMRGISKSYVADKPALYDVNVDPVDRGLLGAAIAGGFTLVTRDDELLEAAARKGALGLDTRK